MQRMLAKLALTTMVAAPFTDALPAQAQETQEYDLPAVVQMALKNHPSLRGVGAQVDEAKAQLKQVKAGYLPKLGTMVSFTQLHREPSFSVAPLGRIVFGEKDNPQSSLTMQFPLFTGGKLEGLSRQAKAAVKASKSVLERQRQKVALDATVAYFNVLKARGFVRVAEEHLKALQSQRDDIAKMLERGVATRIDLLRVETAVSAAQEGLTKAQNGEAVSIAALANAIGLPADTPLKVTQTDSFPYDLPTDIKAAIAESRHDGKLSG